LCLLYILIREAGKEPDSEILHCAEREMLRCKYEWVQAFNLLRMNEFLNKYIYVCLYIYIYIIAICHTGSEVTIMWLSGVKCLSSMTLPQPTNRQAIDLDWYAKYVIDMQLI
jgi:hypothetical protein